MFVAKTNMDMDIGGRPRSKLSRVDPEVNIGGDLVANLANLK